MSHGSEEIEYEKKGNFVVWFFAYFLVFVLMLIYIYGRNGDGLPPI